MEPRDKSNDNSTVEAATHIVNAPVFRDDLITWGQNHRRDFPWRLTKDPYQLLMAEIMLHRTQARQVVPVYERFLELYPNLPALTRASREEIKNVLYPLGLHWRIDLVSDMVDDLINRFDSCIPESRDDLLSLPGVSDYIAGAVRCFAFGKADALVDTNTVRVVGRVFALEIKPSSRRNRRYRRLITALVDPARPEEYNYSLLDLAHLRCFARKDPDCHDCPLLFHCAYGRRKVID